MASFNIGELVTLLGIFHDLLREFQPEQVEVYRHSRLSVLVEPLGEAIGEEFGYLLYVFVHDVVGLEFEFSRHIVVFI